MLVRTADLNNRVRARLGRALIIAGPAGYFGEECDHFLFGVAASPIYGHQKRRQTPSFGERPRARIALRLCHPGGFGVVIFP